MTDLNLQICSRERIPMNPSGDARRFNYHGNTILPIVAGHSFGFATKPTK